MAINVFAQAPNITYANPPVYSVGTTITPLVALNTGGAVPANHYGQTTIFAGNSNSGNADGSGASASFNNPRGLTIDAAGNIYVADRNNNLIRKITPTGTVKTITGFGYVDAAGNSVNLSSPSGLTVDAVGNIYVAAEGDNQIKKITPSNIVTTLAGNGSIGSDDGVGLAAYFHQPLDVTVDADGNVFVADIDNNAIRKITPGGVVTTFAGGSSGYVDDIGTAAKFKGPSGLVIDALGNVYVADLFNHVIRKITPAGKVTTFAGIGGQQGEEDGPVANATLNYPYKLAIDVAGNIYASEANGGNRIRKITPSGIVSTVQHNINAINAEGKGVNTGEAYASGVVVNNDGFLFMSDVGVNNIYKVVITGYGIDKPLPAGLSFDTATGIISGTPTVASPAQDFIITAYNLIGSSSFKITIKITAGVLPPAGSPPVIAYSTPNVYHLNSAIPPLKPTNNGGIVPANTYGLVSSFAGTGELGNNNGPGTNASFHGVYNVATDAAGNVYVADQGNNQIRKITPDGNVSIFAGTGDPGTADGPGVSATFQLPLFITTDANNNVYVSDPINGLLRKISPSGNVISVNYNIRQPGFLAFDADGNLYFSHAYNINIFKVTPAGMVTIYAGNGSIGVGNGPRELASFGRPTGLAVDAGGNLYIADASNSLIRKIDKLTGIVSTFAGGAANNVDGMGIGAGFTTPNSLTFDALGNLYVGDIGSHRIRKITPGGNVTTLVGNNAGNNNGIGTNASINYPAGLAMDNNGHLFVGELNNNWVRKIDLTGYTINKPLPAGLTFDTKTGIISGTPTEISSAADYTITAYNLGGSSIFTTSIKILEAASITATDVSGDVIACEGKEGTTHQQFTVSGTDLSAGITVTAPAGFEVSATAVGGYGSTITLPQTSGKVNGVKIYVQMIAGSMGSHQDNITLSSPGAINVNVPVKGTITANKITSVAITLNVNPSCQGATVDFTAINPVNGGVKPVYLWKVNGSPVGNEKNAIYETSALVNNDVVTCTLINTTDCTGTPIESDPIIVKRTPLVGPDVVITPTSVYPACPGIAVAFTATPVYAGSNYQWQVNGENTGSNSPDFAGDGLREGDRLTCTITTTSECAIPATSDPLIFAVAPLPTVAFSGNVVVNAQSSVTLRPVITGDIASYSWSPTVGLNSADVKYPVANPLVTTTYTLQVITTAGCPVSALVTVTVVHSIEISNTFTPNGDGYNDTWTIPELEGYPGCTVNVYNRNGAEVFKSVGYSRPWNGTYNNKILPYGTYYYVIDPKNGFSKLTGSVTIIR
ncbi:T9SS type B sorting domain-containing protein [Mucilaginibacter pineti]|nr:gliding motility-associated C-terminal domain-containing protein [Mucilaginibacter pineti]